MAWNKARERGDRTTVSEPAERYTLPEVESRGPVARPGIPIQDMRRLSTREDSVRQWFGLRARGHAFPEKLYKINLETFIRGKRKVPNMDELKRIVFESIR